MKAILDTSVILSSTLESLEGELGISAASLAELHFGIMVAKSETIRAERLRRLSVIEHYFDPVPINDLVAQSCGRLTAAVSAIGRQPRARVMDLLIASTAHAYEALRV